MLRVHNDEHEFLSLVMLHVILRVGLRLLKTNVEKPELKLEAVMMLLMITLFVI